jgi:hypothetical protein
MDSYTSFLSVRLRSILEFKSLNLTKGSVNLPKSWCTSWHADFRSLSVVVQVQPL